MARIKGPAAFLDKLRQLFSPEREGCSSFVLKLQRLSRRGVHPQQERYAALSSERGTGDLAWGGAKLYASTENRAYRFVRKTDGSGVGSMESQETGAGTQDKGSSFHHSHPVPARITKAQTGIFRLWFPTS